MTNAPHDEHYPGPALLPRIVTRTDLAAAGFSRRAIEHRLTIRQWHRVLPKVYLTGNTLTWSDRLAAALAFGGEDAVLTAGAALADLGLRTVNRPRRVLLLVPVDSRVRPTSWVRVRRTARDPGRSPLLGPRRARLARAVADLALERPRLDDVRALVTQAVRAELCTPDELHAELATGPRRHSRNLRIALSDVRDGAWSAPEARAARLLRSADVPPFEQNAAIHLPGGGLIIADFLWRSLRAVLEIDSVEHHFLTPAQREATDERHLTLQTAGYATAHRTPWTILNRPTIFVRGIERWLAARARELAA